LGVPFLDTDDLIVEREGMSIKEIIEAGGWNFFRKKEKEVLQELQATEGSVIATGGGIFDDSDNRVLLQKRGIFFWLTADEDTIIERMITDHRSEELRPSLTQGDLRSDVAITLRKREPVYSEMADFIVDTSGKELHAVVDEIYGTLKGKGKK